MKNKWTIINTSNVNGNFIHLEYLSKSNPNAQIMTMDWSKYNIETGWLECDKVLRKWVYENIDKIQNENIAFVEYDVLITKELPDIESKNFLYATIFSPPDWHGWQDVDKLGHLKNYAKSVQVFGMYMMSRNCLDFYLDSEYDFLYSEKMSCELRFPTIMNYNGVEVNEYSHMSNCRWGPDIDYDINIPDYYHPVKKPVLTNQNKTL